MPLGPRRSARAVRVRPRSRHVWTFVDTGSLAIAAAAFRNVDLLAPLAVAGSSVLGLTVVRTHVRIQAWNFASSGDQLLAGCLVTESSNIGTTVNLASNGARSWAMYDQLMPHSTGATIDQIDRFAWDIKAMRRIADPADTYAFAIMNNSAGAFNFRASVRTLVKLP